MKTSAKDYGKAIGRINDTDKFEELTKLLMEFLYEGKYDAKCSAGLVSLVLKKQERLSRSN